MTKLKIILENTWGSFILGAFAILRKATITFVMSARPSVHQHKTTRFSLDEF